MLVLCAVIESILRSIDYSDLLLVKTFLINIVFGFSSKQQRIAAN